MSESEIDVVRALLTSKPRPVGWAERRGVAAVFLIPERAGVKAVKTSAWK